MKTSKPLRLSVLIRPYELARRRLGVVTLFAPFRLDDPQHLLTDMEMWTAIAEVLGEQVVFDEGLAKTSSEVLAAGHVYPRNPPQAASYARVTITGKDGKPRVDKRVAAFGDRQWKRGVPSEPAPFSKMPLVWERAFGGDDFERNPSGRGAAPQGDDDARVHWLPNLEDPAHLVKSPSDAPRPRTLLPFGPAWPQRLSKQGKNYDEKWLRERSPGPADDIDPTFYHLAAEDQRCDGYLSGGERFAIENMHPDHARIEGELPALVARAFVSRRPASEKRPRRGRPAPGPLEEVKTRLETLWLLPDAMLGVLVFRGTTPVRDDDLADLEQLVCGLEDPRTPRTLEHYEKALADRLDPEMGALFALADDDLLPPEELGWKVSFPSFEIEDKIRSVGHMEANVRRAGELKRETIKQELLEKGLDPRDFGVDVTPEKPEVPTAREPRKLAAFVKAQMARFEIERARAAQERVLVEERTRELEADRQAYAKESGMSFPTLEEAGRREIGPPKVEVKLRVDRALAGVDEAARSGLSLAHVREMVGDSKTLLRLEQQELRAVEAYRLNAHLFPPGYLPADEVLLARRGQAQIAKEIGESLAGVDLCGADLSGLDLSGMDLSDAFLESARLVGTKLTGAKLDRAVFAQADLTDANLEKCSAKGTNFGAAKLVRTSLRGSDATDAVFMRAKLEQTCLAEVKLDGALLLEVETTGVDLSGATGEMVLFHKLALQRTKLDGARMTKAVFLECQLDEASFRGATFHSMQLIATSAKRIRAEGASFVGSFMGADSSLDGAVLDGADLSKCSLRTTSMVGASLRGAHLASADLSECDATTADFEGAKAERAMLTRTILRGAKLRGANLMEGMLSKADLAECDLSHTNLFRADLTQVHLSGGTRIDGALLDFARVDPKEAKEDA